MTSQIRSSKVIPFPYFDLFRSCIDGVRVVSTNGCFDILHIGHILYLQKARTFGDVLIVGINNDSGVAELKGEGRPINSQEHRAYVLSALSFVDFVTVFDGKSAKEFISASNPDVYVKGGDYNVKTLEPSDREILEEMGTECRFVDFEVDVSTTKILQRTNKI